MRCTLALGLACAASLCGQPRTWQDRCFQNPALPYCKGREFAVKPTKPEAAPRSVYNNSFPSSTPQPANPSLIVLGGNEQSPVAATRIDWRFADPAADALVGLNLGSLMGSPLARWIMTYFGATQGVAAADIEKLFDRLSAVDQAIISIRNGRVVAMLTGRVTESPFPPGGPGSQAVLVAANMLLAGHSDAVDQAVNRMRGNVPLSEIGRMAGERSAISDIWAVGSPALAGPQMASSGVRRFSLTVSVRDRLNCDVVLEFTAPPTPARLHAMQGPFGQATIEGNAIRVRMSMESAELQQKLPQIAAAIGPHLGQLIAAGRSLSPRDNSASSQSRR